MKSGGLVAALAFALALLAGLVWWLARDGDAPSEVAGGSRASVSSEAPLTTLPRVDAPSSNGSSVASSTPQQREARGNASYAPKQGPAGSLLVRAVWGSSGKPAVNVEVRVERRAGTLLQLAEAVRTDASGAAAFDAVECGLHVVRGDRSGSAICQIREGQRTELELPLDLGATVTGTILDSAGRNVSQGAVWILSNGRWVELVECEASSRYSVANVPVGSRLMATGRDLAPSRIAAVTADAQGRAVVDFRLEGPAASVLGQVLDPQEQPVARAVVVLADVPDGPQLLPLSQAPRRTAACDAEGRFVLHSVPAGPVTLVVQSEHFAPRVERLVVVPASRNEVILSLSLGAELTGVVTREGQPVAAAQVLVDARGLGMCGGAATDAQGRYRLTGLPEGDVTVIALEIDSLQESETGIEAALRSNTPPHSRHELELVAGRAVIWNPELKPKD